MFTCQADLEEVQEKLQTDGMNPDLLKYQRLSQQAVQDSIAAVDGIQIHPFNLLDNFKGVEKSTTRRSNTHYLQYGVDYAVENLLWSADIILNTCKELLRDKIREELVGVSDIEAGRSLVLKLMLDNAMDVEDSTFSSLMQGM